MAAGIARTSSRLDRDARSSAIPRRVASTPPRTSRATESGSSASTRNLAAALAGLPGPQRAVIEMRVLDGRPYAEVAQGLAITPGAARVRAHRGLASLRASLRAAPAPAASTPVNPKETTR